MKPVNTPMTDSPPAMHLLLGLPARFDASRWRPILAVFLLLITLALIGFFASGRLSFEQLHDHELAIRQSVTDHWWLSLLIGFFVYTAASLIPGTTGKSIIFGWLFGFWRGIVIVSCSLTIAAMISFTVARLIFRDWLRNHRLRRLIARMDAAIDREGALYLLTLRLIHVPYSLLNYAAGASGISPTTFGWTTFIGMLPGNIAFVLAGSQLPTVGEAVKEGVWSVVDVRLLLVLSLAALIPVLARRIVRWIRSRRPRSVCYRTGDADHRRFGFSTDSVPSPNESEATNQ